MMEVSKETYYKRTPEWGGKNTVRGDLTNQRKVAEICEKTWNCKFHQYAHFDTLDWWIERDGRTVAFAELKIKISQFLILESILEQCGLGTHQINLCLLCF